MSRLLWPALHKSRHQLVSLSPDSALMPHRGDEEPALSSDWSRESYSDLPKWPGEGSYAWQPPPKMLHPDAESG